MTEVTQQGKEYTKEQKEMIVNSLQPYLEMGFSRNKACEFIGFTPATLSLWLSKDNALLMKVVGWENMISTTAMQNIKQAVMKESELDDDLRKENSWKWVERKLKDMSPKQDITSDGEAITSVSVTIKRNETGTGSDTDIRQDITE